MERKTHTIDAAGEVLGRLATRIAVLLQGKTKADFERRVDSGDFVKVINASKLKLTGRKADMKMLRHHSWHPGGLKEEPLGRAMENNPAAVLRRAVSKMLPRNKHQKLRIARLTIEA